MAALLLLLACWLGGCDAGSLEPFSGSFSATLSGPEGDVSFSGRALALRGATDGVYTIGLLEEAVQQIGFTGRAVTIAWHTPGVQAGTYPVRTDQADGSVTVFFQGGPTDPFAAAAGVGGTVRVASVNRLASRGEFEITLRTTVEERTESGPYTLRGTFEAAPLGL